ncbi:MAG TPA: efflux RND transporter periplasmic adaptor subunit [Polyangiaceae bacterium]|nr:efflux RND transporter periplasmic adaptor subunit [Polyangiaceae bacterium]
MKTIPRRPRPRLAHALLLPALGAPLAACGHEPRGHAAPPLPPQRVEVAVAREVARPTGDHLVGTVRARSEAAVAPSVTGTVRAVRVAVGSRVKAGDLLAQLSAGEVTAKAAQARAVLAQASVRFDRAAQLKASGSIAQAEYDAAESQRAIARAGLQEAEAMLAYLSVRAPVDGVVTAKRCEVGDLALAGRPLFTIEQPGALRLEVGVPEAIAHHAGLGTALTVRVDTLEREVTGKVDEVSPSADAQSRTVQVKIALPEEKAGPALRAGMFARVLVPTGETRGLEVPRAALVRRGQLELVYVVAQGHAVLRLVRAGQERDAAVDVLAGLTPGESVVVGGLGGLVDGQPVEVTP